MNTSYEGIVLRIFRSAQEVYATSVNKPLEVGRQRQSETNAITRIAGDRVDRIVAASIDESTVSRSQLLVEPIDAFSVRLTNLSDTRIVDMERGMELLPGEQCVTGDVCLAIDVVQVYIQIPQWNNQEFCMLPRSPAAEQPRGSLDATNDQQPALARLLHRANIGDQQHQASLLATVDAVCDIVSGIGKQDVSVHQRLAERMGFDFAGIYQFQGHRWRCDWQTPALAEKQVDWMATRLGQLLFINQLTTVQNASPGQSPSDGFCRIAVPLRFDGDSIVRVFYAERSIAECGLISQPEAKITEMLVVTADRRRELNVN